MTNNGVENAVNSSLESQRYTLDSGKSFIFGSARKTRRNVEQPNHQDKIVIQSISPEVAEVFDRYPRQVRSKLMNLRRIISETASAISIIREIEETLKWGEPSYLVKPSRLGSTVRIDWKASRERVTTFLSI